MITRSLLIAASFIIVRGWGENCALAFAPRISSDGVTPPSHRRRSAFASSTTTMMTSSPDRDTRRSFLVDFSKLAAGCVVPAVAIVAITATSYHSSVAHALDFDAFERGEIATDTEECNPRLDPKCIPKLTHDEALCKYGVVGATERTAACRRVRDAGGQLPNASKAGERSTMGWLNGDIALTK